MQCKSCGSKWESKTQVESCPFCGKSLQIIKNPEEINISDVIEHIISIRGIEVLKNSKLITSYVMDLVRNHEHEKKLLRVLCNYDIFSGAYNIVITTDPMQRDIIIKRQYKILIDEAFLPESIATEALNIVLRGIGVNELECNIPVSTTDTTISKPTIFPMIEPANKARNTIGANTLSHPQTRASNTTGTDTSYTSSRISPSSAPNEDEDDGDELDEFDDIEFALYDKNNLHIEFCNFEVDDDDVYMCFWANNKSNRTYKLWIRDIKVDGEQVDELKFLITVPIGEADFGKIKLSDISPNTNYTVDAYIEVDDENHQKLDRTQRFSVEVDFNDFTQNVELIGKEEYDDDVSDEFDDIEFALYDKNNLHIEFCNFEVDDDDVYMCFWANNKSNRTYKLWIRDIKVDGEQVTSLKSLITVPAGKAGFGKIKLSDISPDTYYTVDAYIEVDDENNKELDRTQRFSVEVDFNNFTQNAEFIDKEDNDDDVPAEFDDIEFEVYNNDGINVEFCRCIVEDDIVKFSFFIWNNSNRNIHVWAKDVCVDGEKVRDFKRIGEVEAGDSDFGEFQLDEVSPESYYNIIACIEIDDEDNDCIDTGDTFSIDVDFDDMTLSAEME